MHRVDTTYLPESELAPTWRREKIAAALSSVVAAVVLTGIKLGAGLSTESLGLLSEAAHSGLDLIAAFLTFLAVRVADRPADASHHYGHGKVESLSALAETMLLLITCFWIVSEAVDRLFFVTVEVNPTWWAFLVMGISIGVDISRAKMLGRVARKYKSQALEADALHFSTDVWSSAVVIFGLFGVVLANRYPAMSFLLKADALAALIVAIIVVGVSLRLGKRTIAVLLDSAPRKLTEQITRVVSQVTGVQSCHNVRARFVGAQVFVDVHAVIDGEQSLSQAHALTEDIERAILAVVPGADITVHPEPIGVPIEGLQN